MLSEELLEVLGLETYWNGTEYVPTVKAEMARELLSLRWRPITPEDIPKVGDELWSEKHGVSDFAHFCTCDRRPLHKIIHMCGWTHFRPKNPPETKDGK